MTRKEQIQKKADFEARNNKAWEKFDKTQAKREAELRRPAYKINVMSDEEHARIGNVRYLYGQYLPIFLYGMKLRDLRFHKEFTDFFIESFDLDSGQKQAASEAATCISNTLSLYCQVHDDPYYILNRTIKDYKGHDLSSLPNTTKTKVPGLPGYVLLGILDGYLELKGGCLAGKDLSSGTGPAAEAIESQKWPSQYITDEITKATQSSGIFQSAGTGGLLKDLLGDSKLTSAFIAIVTNLCLETTQIIEEASMALVQLSFLTTEGASGDVPDTISMEKIGGLHRAIFEFKKAPSEVTQTAPWITRDEDEPIKRRLGLDHM